ncbi:MAG: hypothetical protein H6Q90_2002 [Deltaproteobacteria bacterium]|nr:hypothetical protein [Deltaproteobacteria bacterium]
MISSCWMMLSTDKWATNPELIHRIVWPILSPGDQPVWIVHKRGNLALVTDADFGLQAQTAGK